MDKPPMKHLFPFFLFFFIQLTLQAQPKRAYFFDEQLPISQTTSLVVLTKEPQSDLAKRIQNRIYRDTTLIRSLKENWYEEYDSLEGKVVHFCDFDLYFYTLEGNTLRYLNKMNSQCGTSGINCTSLEILAQKGEKLFVDTLTGISENQTKSSVFNENFLTGNYNSMEEWDICRSMQFPKIFYDGYIKTRLELDTLLSLLDNVEHFLGNNSKDFSQINWNVWGSMGDMFIKLKRFELFHEPCTIELYIYLKREQFKAFEHFDIHLIPFQVYEKEPLFLTYINHN
jgi:hypothetical protein